MNSTHLRSQQIRTSVVVGLRLDGPDFKLSILELKKQSNYVCFLHHSIYSQQPTMCWLREYVSL